MTDVGVVRIARTTWEVDVRGKYQKLNLRRP